MTRKIKCRGAYVCKGRSGFISQRKWKALSPKARAGCKCIIAKGGMKYFGRRKGRR